MTEKDFSTISPSAKALLHMKGLTDIPFAREASALMPDFGLPGGVEDDVRFWARVLHFEQRYKSINQLMAGLKLHNVLELSAGFSFRGLHMTTTQENIHYIDTDLPGITSIKQSFIDKLATPEPRSGSKLEILPLNALDEAAFREVISHFGPGPILIVNEGLLMYLEQPEKEKLCRIIHRVLQERRGHWITADIYTQIMMPVPPGEQDDALNKFLAEHRTEEKKFETFGSAASFLIIRVFSSMRWSSVIAGS